MRTQRTEPRHQRAEFITEGAGNGIAIMEGDMPETPKKMPGKKKVVGLRVSSDCSQGGRKYMEDVISIVFDRREDSDYACFAVLMVTAADRLLCLPAIIYGKTSRNSADFSLKILTRLWQRSKKDFLLHRLLWRKLEVCFESI